jgi:TP901 family phage tail tape measure protein
MAFGISHTIGVLVRGQNMLTSSLLKAEHSLTKFRKTAHATSLSINKSFTPPDVDMSAVKEASGHLTGMGTKAILAGASMGIGLGIAVKRASDFNTAMTEVSTLVDTSTTDMGALSNEVRNLSREFGEMPVDTTKALYTTISAGFGDAAQATTLLTGAMKLARGGLASLDVSIDGLTSILNSYGMAADQVTYVSDRMFVAMKAGKTTIAELSSSLGRVTPIASTVGVSIDEVLASVSALTLGGLQTAEATTAVRGILAAVVKKSSESIRAAKEMGIEFNVAAIKSKGFANWLAEVGEKTGGSQEKMAMLFGRVEALSGALALTGNQAGSFASILDQMGSAAGATETAFKKVEATFAVAFKKMRVNIWLVYEQIGQALLPSITGVANAISTVAGKLSTFAQAHPILTKIVSVVAMVTAGVLVLGGAGLIMAGQVVMAMTMVNVSTGGVLLAIGGLITGISLLVLWFTRSSDEASESGGIMATAWGYVKKAFYAMATPVAYGLGFLVGTMTIAWRKVAAYTAEVWPMIKDIVLASWGIVATLLTPQIALLTGAFVAGWGMIKTVTIATWETIKLSVSTAWKMVTNIIGLGWNLISGIFKAGLQILTGDWAGAWVTIKDTASAMWGNIQGLFEAWIGWVTGLGTIFYDAGAGMIDSMWNGIQAGWNRLKSGFTDLVGWMREMLPGSDAVRGPLADLTAAGKALLPTFGKGILASGKEPAKALSSSLMPVRAELSSIAAPQRSPNIDVAAPVGAAGSLINDSSSRLVIEKGAIVINASDKGVAADLEQELEKLLARLNSKWGPAYA